MKRIFEGSFIDGNVLVELVVRIVWVINVDVWYEFGNVYDVIEKDICKRSYEKLIKFLFVVFKLEEIKSNMSEVLWNFIIECVLEREIVDVKEELLKFVEKMKEKEKLEEKVKKVEYERNELERKLKKEKEELM